MTLHDDTAELEIPVHHQPATTQSFIITGAGHTVSNVSQSYTAHEAAPVAGAQPYAWPRTPDAWRSAASRASKTGRSVTANVGDLQATWHPDGSTLRVDVIDPDARPDWTVTAAQIAAAVAATIAGHFAEPLAARVAITLVLPIMFAHAVGTILRASRTRELRPALRDTDDDPADIAADLLDEHRALLAIAAAHDNTGGLLDRAAERDHRLLWHIAGDCSPAQERHALTAHAQLYTHACAIDEHRAVHNPGTPPSDAVEQLEQELAALDAAHDELTS